MHLPAGRRHGLRWVLVVAPAVLLHGCGQTGPLFLPEEPTAGSDEDLPGIATEAEVTTEGEAAQNAGEEEDGRDD